MSEPMPAEAKSFGGIMSETEKDTLYSRWKTLDDKHPMTYAEQLAFRAGVDLGVELGIKKTREFLCACNCACSEEKS